MQQQRSKALRIAYIAATAVLLLGIIAIITRTAGLLDKEKCDTIDFGSGDSGPSVYIVGIISIVLLLIVMTLFVLPAFNVFSWSSLDKRRAIGTVVKIIVIVFIIFAVLGFIALLNSAFYDNVVTFRTWRHSAYLPDFEKQYYGKVYCFAIRLFIEQILMSMCCAFIGVFVIINILNSRFRLSFRGAFARKQGK